MVLRRALRGAGTPFTGHCARDVRSTLVLFCNGTASKHTINAWRFPACIIHRRPRLGASYETRPTLHAASQQLRLPSMHSRMEKYRRQSFPTAVHRFHNLSSATSCNPMSACTLYSLCVCWLSGPFRAPYINVPWHKRTLTARLLYISRIINF